MITSAMVALFMWAGGGAISADPGALAQSSPAGSLPANEAAGRPIEGEALRELLRDVFVALPRAPGVLTRQLGEVFRYNGAYERIAYWGRRQGTFSIEGDAVCIEGPSLARQCRRVFVVPDGTYAFVDTEDGSSASMTIAGLGSDDNRDAQARIATGDSQLRRLTDSQVVEFVRGRRLSGRNVGGEIRGQDLVEMFGRNSEYTWFAERVSIQGSYSVRDGELCTVIPTRAASLCRRFYQGRRGDYYQAFLRQNAVNLQTVLADPAIDVPAQQGHRQSERPLQANANPSSECASRTGYRRLDNREIEAAIVDNTLVHDWRSGIYRAVRSERFYRQRNRYRVRYHGQLGGGSYEITGGRLCTRELNDSAVLCRRMFQSSEYGYALSDPGADFPRYRVTIHD